MSRHNFRKLKMWPVTTLLVIGAVARAISQAPLFHTHSGYEADHCHPCLQMPENKDGILYLYNRVLVKSAAGIRRPWRDRANWRYVLEVLSNRLMEQDHRNHGSIEG